MNLCCYLRKGDVEVLQKRERGAAFPRTPGPSCPFPPPGCAAHLGVSAAEFETLREEPDSVSRKFYQDFSEDVVELSQLVPQ